MHAPKLTPLVKTAQRVTGISTYAAICQRTHMSINRHVLISPASEVDSLPSMSGRGNGQGAEVSLLTHSLVCATVSQPHRIGRHRLLVP